MDKIPMDIQLKIGEKYHLKLEGNLSTGYDWTFTKDHSEAVMIDKEIKINEPRTEGNSNTITFIITGVAKGRCHLVFVYHKPWEVDVPPVEQLVVDVGVN